MKNFNRALCVILSFASAYLFWNVSTDKELVIGFVALLMAILFFCFSVMDEQKSEIERLRKTILNKI